MTMTEAEHVKQKARATIVEFLEPDQMGWAPINGRITWRWTDTLDKSAKNEFDVIRARAEFDVLIQAIYFLRDELLAWAREA